MLIYEKIKYFDYNFILNPEDVDKKFIYSI
jgi:hypothetical protein